MDELAQILARWAMVPLGVALVVVAVCRLHLMTSETTLARVRHAAAAQLGTGVLLVFTALVLPGWIWAAAALSGGSALAWQMATSHAWRGLPASMARSSATRRPWTPTVAVLREVRQVHPGDDPPTIPMTEREMRRVREG